MGKQGRVSMEHITITAEIILQILQNILESEPVNILNGQAQEAFGATTLQEALNIEYYTFNYTRPTSFEQLQAVLTQMDRPPVMNQTKSFCLYTHGNTQQVYASDVDKSASQGIIDFWVQIEKIQMIEYLIAQVNKQLNGIPKILQFPNNQVRKLQFIVDFVNRVDYAYNTPIGDIAHLQLTVLMWINPSGTITYSDYLVHFAWTSEDGNLVSANVPLTSINLSSVMNERAMPMVGNQAKVGNVNLSNANEFAITFDGDSDNLFIQHLTDVSLSQIGVDNNQVYTLTITRAGKQYVHEVIIKQHQITIRNDTSNETHSLNLVTRNSNVGVSPVGSTV